jgi:DNA-binding Xre family transcriptional regulator
MRQSIAGPSAVNVRRWIWEQNTGETLNGTKESIKMRACCDGNCIDFKHMVKKSRSQLLKGKVQTISTRIKMSRKLADKYNKGKDLVETIRVSEKGSAELAREHGMSRSNVWQIRTGKTFKLESTHFSGLGARA